MTTEGREPDYPYAARYNSNNPPADSPTSASQRHWSFAFRIARRLSLLASAIVVAAIIAGAWIGYRAARQAWLVHQLERLGCSVVYSHEYPGQKSRVPDFLRERFGNDLWSGVSKVSIGGFYFGPSEEDIQTICDTCGNLDQLRSLKVVSDHFKFDHISSWRSLSRLEEIEIASPKLTDNDLKSIGGLARLTKLDLSRGKFTNAGLAHLEGLAQLESLTFSSVAFDGKAVQNKRGLPSLKRLEIEDSPSLTDDTITSLGPLPKLTIIIANRAGVGDLGAVHLAKSGRLDKAILNETNVSDSGVEALLKCPSITCLHLQGTKVTDQGLAALPASNITSLILDTTAVTDETIRLASQLPNLQYLSLAETKATGEGAAHLRKPGWGPHVGLADHR